MRGSLYKDYKTLQSLRENSIVNILNEKKKSIDRDFENKRLEIESLRNRRNVQRESVANYREYVLTELTITAMQAIYMSAVTECTVLTRESKIIGENMAVNYIVENDGVYNVLNKMKGTYFLERVRDIIYEATEDAEKKKEEEKENPSQDEPKKEKEDTSSENNEKKEDDEDLVTDMEDKEDSNTSEEEEEEPETSDKEEKDEKEETEEGEDSSEKTDDLDLESEDEPKDVSNNDIPTETKEEMLDKLEKEEDTDTAIDIIAQRISKAEEEFIKKNAQDKQKIEDIVDNINDRINGAKADPNNSDEDVEEIEQEAAIEMKRKISKIRDDRPHTVFEMMVRQLSEGIMSDQTLMEDYCDTNGKINMETVVEVTKCVYGFLEFVNTVQLEKVDEAYIKHVIESI